MPTPPPTSILCPHCNALNPPGARFCRQCGKPLQEKPQPHPVPPQPKPQPVPNVMDRYPKYKFRPTKMYDWRRPKFGRFLRWAFCIVAFLFLIFGSGYFVAYDSWRMEGKLTPSYYDEENDYWHEAKLSYEIKSECVKPWSLNDWMTEWNDTLEYNRELREQTQARMKGHLVERYHEECLLNGGIAIGVSLFVLIFLAFLPFRGCGLPKTKLTDLADYIQRYHYTGMFRRKRTPKYVFFVKDNRFGVMDVAHYRIALEAGYARLEWREKNRLLYAYTDGGQKVTIDLKGHILK